MSIYRTYFDKNNTILKNNYVNTGRNPVTELFFGGETNSATTYSRFIFYFDEQKLKDLYTGNTITDLSRITHTLNLTNTTCFDTSLLGQLTCGCKRRASSFDLIVFKINQEWDEGHGYDAGQCSNIESDKIDIDETFVLSQSNWFERKRFYTWGTSGIYSGQSDVEIVGTQHFDLGNENLKIDLTQPINDILTGTTNYGFGIAFDPFFENQASDEQLSVGFFTRHTHTFFEPYLESRYDDLIDDNRYEFYTDKDNKLYLYTNVGNTPINLDEKPIVTIYDNDDVIIDIFSGDSVIHVTKGVYSITLNIPSASYSECLTFKDVWSNIKINGISRPNVTLEFYLSDPNEYYNFGEISSQPIEYGFSLSGIKRDEEIKRGDIRKVIVSARELYNISESFAVNGLSYRLYVKEGNAELTVIDWEEINRTPTHNYFLLDTSWLIPNIYYLDLKFENNQQVKHMNELMRFEIISQVEQK